MSSSISFARQELRRSTAKKCTSHSENRIVKYNLAFIHFGMCQVDHGRVVGYDNAHGFHERHFMDQVEPVEFTSYGETLKRFQAEVAHYRETA